MLDQHAQGRGLIAVEADPDRASARKRASARSGSAMRNPRGNRIGDPCMESYMDSLYESFEILKKGDMSSSGDTT